MKKNIVENEEMKNKKKRVSLKSKINKKTIYKKKAKVTEDIKASISFNLMEVVIIILITGVIVSILSGVIVYNNYDRLNVTSNQYENKLDDNGLNKFRDNYNRLLSRYVKEIDKDELLDSAIKGMYDYLGDDYSMYIDKENSTNLEESLQGEYTGIGVEISSAYTDEGTISIITKVFKDSPAEKVGIKVGDQLVSLNGVLLKDKEASYVSNTIKYGKEDTHVLKVLREGKEIEVKVSRKLVFINYVHSEVLDNNIGYIKIDSFGATTAKQVKEAIDKFDKKIDSLIVDVRDNSGGYLHSAGEISNIFIEKNKNLYQVKDRNDKVTIYKANNDIYRKFNKIVVLVNENSASASEILALALKESANAKIVGVKSYGKGTIQETETLENGAMIKYTTAYWLSANGNLIDKKGITPDVEEKDVTKQLDTAKKIIKEK